MCSGRRGLFAFVSLLSTIAACALPEGDQSSPTQLHYRWMTVRAAGDGDQLWELLHPDVKAEFERWLLAEKRAVNEIKTAYPKEDATAALLAMGGAERGELDLPRSLFKRFLKPSPEVLGTLGEMAAHVRSEEISEDGAKATIRTFGGDEVAFARGDDGLWYATLAPEEAERLKNARARAEQNLERVKANLKKLGKNQP